jgi:LPS export ABC transporter permease LptG/LPS export ABC transporter permease LptF
MRILTRYILKEVFSHSLLGLLIFTFVIFIPHISHLLEMMVRHELSGVEVLTLFLLPFPGIVVLTIPMAVLVGILIGLSRMAADGEVVAARASGMGLSSFVRPVMIFALIGWGLASWMSLVLGPRAGRTLSRLETRLAASQIPYEIQPRVFIEQFPNLLLYIEDVTGTGSRWRGVFIADTTERDSPKITLAKSGMLVNDPSHDRLVLHLEQGSTHETEPGQSSIYSVATFKDTDLPVQLQGSNPAQIVRRTPATDPLALLFATARFANSPDERRAARVELNYRFALPVASLVLALVGIPLGLFSRKGGKAVGIMLALFLVFTYYVIMAFGLSFAKQGRIPPAVGVWLANAAFGAVGLLMFSNLRRVRLRLQFLQEWAEELSRLFADFMERLPHRPRPESVAALHPHATTRYRFFQILDGYVLRGWIFYFVVLLVAFCGIYTIFDFFQLLGDIIRNHISPGIVLDYYRYLTPQVVYLMFPLSILVATLVSFGLLTKSNELTAIKSAGVSLYRISAPVLIAAILASAGMFALDDGFLPQTNQRQDALRNQIKGKPPQTYMRPDRQWIFGEGDRIYNYRFFDADQNVFADLSVFEFDPRTFELTRRIYAERARWEQPIHGWVLEQGWVRNLDGDRVTSYTPFAVATFAELTEAPAYFKKEVKPSAQMSALELRRYIKELSQSGFDVVRLSVQFYKKFSFPLMCFVVALIGIPFALTTGRKGAIAGIATSIGIAILYWASTSLFEAMGNLSQLPPGVAAWSPDVLFGLGGIYLFLRVRT